jgi:hypothetical protein
MASISIQMNLAKHCVKWGHLAKESYISVSVYWIGHLLRRRASLIDAWRMSGASRRAPPGKAAAAL